MAPRERRRVQKPQQPAVADLKKQLHVALKNEEIVEDLQTIIRQVHAMRSGAARQQPASSGD